MDPIVAVICLACGVAIPVVVAALIGRRAHRQLATAGAYREVAQGLGLAVDTRGCSLHGMRGDRPLWVGEVLVGDGPERHREVHGVIGLARPLSIGVEIRRRRSRREPSVGLEIPELDKRLVVRLAFDGGLPVVRDEPVLEALQALCELATDVQITDERVRVRMKRAPSNASTLGSLVARLETLAQTLETAREQTGPAPEPAEWMVGWSEIADAWGLTLQPTRPSLAGRLEGWPVEVVPTCEDGHWRAWMVVRFDPETDTGLRVQPQRHSEGDVADGQDILIGDEAFDRAFVVKGYDPAAVRERLGDPVRAALMALRRCGRITLDDHRLVGRGISPDTVGQALTHAATVSREVVSEAADPRVIDVV